MKINKIATSIVEAIIIVLVIAFGLTWVYMIYSESIRFVDSTQSKIQAIQIAREWLEAVENIRDTNWQLFSSDTANCWNVLNYDWSCIWNNSITKMNWDYKVFRDKNNRWILEHTGSLNPNTYINKEYQDFYEVKIDKNWLYTQTWTIKMKSWAIFTRRINIKPWVNLSYIDWSNIETQSSTGWMIVTAIVEWRDMSIFWLNYARKIEISNVLTNYKN